MISVHNILLEPDVNTTTIYTSSQNKLCGSIIDKLQSFDVPNISEDRNNISIVHETIYKDILQNKVNLLRQESIKCDYFIEQNLRTQIANISNRYSILCFENIKIKQQLEIQNQHIKHLQLTNSMIQTQLIRILDENKILSLEKIEIQKKSKKQQQSFNKILKQYSKCFVELMQKNEKFSKQSIKDVMGSDNKKGNRDIEKIVKSYQKQQISPRHNYHSSLLQDKQNSITTHQNQLTPIKSKSCFKRFDWAKQHIICTKTKRKNKQKLL